MGATQTTRRSRTAAAAAKNAQIVNDAGAPGHVLTAADVPRYRWRTDIVDPVVSFVVYGLPAAQGSKAYAGHRNGKPRLEEQNAGVDPWRRAVREMARRALRDYEARTGARWKALDEPVLVSAVVTVPSTGAATARGDVYAHGVPDLDKLERAIGDALAPQALSQSEGKGLSETARRQVRSSLLEQRRANCLLHDDSRIVAWDHVAKVYPRTTLNSLAYPGVLIEIWRMADLQKASARPVVEGSDGYQHMRAGDLAGWARPASGETWAEAAHRLWSDPDRILTSSGTVTLRGRAIGDEGLRIALRELALNGPDTTVAVADEPLPAREGQ